MNKTSLVFFACFLLLVKAAYSSQVEVGVSQVLDGSIIAVSYDSSSDPVNISEEFYNTGSVPYKARVKAEIFNSSDIIFSGWSSKEVFMPGDKKISDIYWYASSPGDYSAKLKVYFGDIIKEYKKIDFSVDSVPESEDVFDISNFRTYDSYVLFDVQSSRNTSNVVIIPLDYTPGWIFEQKEIPSIAENSSKYIMLSYQPSLWAPSTVKMAIVSDGGRYYTEKTLEMNKLDGLAGMFYYVVDSIRFAISG